MDPISNQVFSHDYQKFVLQEPDVRMVQRPHEDVKPFSTKPVNKASRTKKDLNKQRQNGLKEEKKKPYEL
jgi:hypothetical protein